MLIIRYFSTRFCYQQMFSAITQMSNIGRIILQQNMYFLWLTIQKKKTLIYYLSLILIANTNGRRKWTRLMSLKYIPTIQALLFCITADVGCQKLAQFKVGSQRWSWDSVRFYPNCVELKKLFKRHTIREIILPLSDDFTS